MILLFNKILKKIIFYKNLLRIIFNKEELICSQILADKYGHKNSVKARLPIDEDGKEMPWFTYPAIEFIKQLDISQKYVFEYGSGNSSIFWGKRAKNVVSVEHNTQWYRKIKQLINSDNEIYCFSDKEEYVNSINKFDKLFDIIVIDAEHRDECAQQAVGKLSNDGVIILDNSDWHVNTAKYLRESGFIQVDMSGFGPINSYTWTTSFFFSRNYNFKPIGRQPAIPIGGIEQLG